MSGSEVKLSTIQREAGRYGLVARGAFAPDCEDGLPSLGDGREAGALVLFGNVGSSLWPAFTASPEFRDGEPNPLDRWSRRIGEALARRFDGEALFPFGGPPYQPFLRWAQRAENVSVSQVGILIHPEHGLWHAYRFALLLPSSLCPAPRLAETDSPCLSCTAKPCLTACPVGAFNEGEYRVDDCVRHLADDARATCNSRGCLARLACPVGSHLRYEVAQARFHMRAFLVSRLAVERDRLSP